MKRFKLYKHPKCVLMPLLSSEYIETPKINTFVQITYIRPVLSSDYALTSKNLKLRTIYIQMPGQLSETSVNVRIAGCCHPPLSEMVMSYERIYSGNA